MGNIRFSKYALLVMVLYVTSCSGQNIINGFKKTVIGRDFISEGVAVADVDKDGQMDVIAGYYWFEAPTWKKHEIAPNRTYDPRKEYCESFLNLGMDVNLDGWDDVIIIDHPGKPGFWFENPKNVPGEWKKHFIADSMGIGNESPGFVDMDGDGRLDILCADVGKKQIVWLQAPLNPGETEWKRFPLSRENVPATERYSHGIGLGDVNKDGFEDVVIADGWFQGKADKGSGDWVFHPVKISEPCSHMHVLDMDGDGQNDIISASAHQLGIWWHRQREDRTFETNLISETTAQTHSTLMADLNGDGKAELITGKRFLAHNGNDPGDEDAPILLWIELTPGIKPFFKEHLIDTDSGAGLNIVVEDMNGDGRPDIVIANKNGIFLFENHLY